MLSRLSYANLMATLAVFIALGGGAYAALILPEGSVKSKQIAKNAVRSKEIAKNAVKRKEIARNAVRSKEIKKGKVKTVDLADGGVTPPKLGDVSFADVFDSGSTSSSTFAELSPAGPQIDVTLAANSFATVIAQATITAPGGATADDCHFTVALSGQGFANQQLPVEGQATFSGPSPGPRTEYVSTTPPLPFGALTMRMMYRRASGDDPCTFSNRRLWVEVSEP
jgi:hypothetical protein